LSTSRSAIGRWTVDALGAPHIGERSEKALISSFVDRIAELSPQLVTFNGSPFDLPVLRYRAMVHGVAAPGLSMRPYFNRYTEDAIDLCDVLSSFSHQGKATLNELCRVMGLPGKPDGISGGEVERYYRDGRVCEIAEYCESDVVNTYRVWLRYELFRGRLSASDFKASEAYLVNFIQTRATANPHLTSRPVRSEPAVPDAPNQIELPVAGASNEIVLPLPPGATNEVTGIRVQPFTWKMILGERSEHQGYSIGRW
jgi:3'-5' exonuclease